MGRKPTGNPTGCPPKEIKFSQFEKMCNIQCTQSEIASCLEIDVDTLVSKIEQHYGAPFSEVYKRFRETGFMSLRRNQYNQSEKNATMAIWLGKQWLGQKDNHDLIVDAKTSNDFTSVMKQLLETQQTRQALPKEPFDTSTNEQHEKLS